MKEFKVELKLTMTYNGDSRNDIFTMIDEEFGLGDKQFDLDIDGKGMYDLEKEDVSSESDVWENKSVINVVGSKLIKIWRRSLLRVKFGDVLNVVEYSS